MEPLDKGVAPGEGNPNTGADILWKARAISRSAQNTVFQAKRPGSPAARSFGCAVDRVIAGRDIRVSVLSDADENSRQPAQIDGDDARALPISIALAAGAVRLLRPA